MTDEKKKTKKVNSKTWYQYAVLFPFYLVFRIWCSTIRVEISEEDVEKISPPKSPQITVFWHNCLFLVPIVKRRYWKKTSLNALISASGDGAWLVALFKLIGLKNIRGSGNFRGAQALKELIKVVRRNEDIGITPDGSKGPPYVFKQGVAAVAKTCKCRINLYGCEFSSAWRLNSWDKFYLPKPFSKVRLRIESIENYQELGAKDLDEASEILQARMMSIMPKDPLIADLGMTKSE